MIVFTKSYDHEKIAINLTNADAFLFNGRSTNLNWN